MQITLNSLADTDNFAGKLSKHLKKGDVVALEGDLGTGKTTLAKSIIIKLCGSGTEVTSPTFNLVQLYDADGFTIWHFDLYRLKSSAELVEIGIDEALSNGLSLIEWPEIANNYLPEDKLIIKLSFGKNNERLLTADGYGKWEERIEKLKF